MPASPVRSLRFRLRALAAITALACAPAAWASPSLDELFDQAMERWDLPGMAVGVIEDGEVTYMRTGGELRAGEGNPVTPDSLFKIASNGKAMTTALLARLVDQGKLEWDDPVSRHLPEFRMADPWASEQIQVRDLVIHNSGLGRAAGDLMLWPSPNRFTREKVVAGIAHLPPRSSFRTSYNYSNVLYVAAGEVAAAASGAGSYEEALRGELFEPLGLQRCRVGEWNRDETGDVAQPHARTEDRNRVVRADGEVVQALPMAAAGGIRCSLRDMTAWMQMWLQPDRHGLVDGEPWLSQDQRRTLWSVHMPMPLGERMRGWEGANFYAYGLGWRLNDSDGHFKVSHTGTLSGMFSAVGLLPEKDSGYVLMINGSGGDARTALAQALTRYLTSPGSGLDVDHYADLLDQSRAESAEGPDADPVPDTSDRVAAEPAGMAQWLGVYEDPWFGEVSVCAVEDDRVGIASRRSPVLTGTVMQSGGRLLVDWDALGANAVPWLDFSRPDDGGPAELAVTRINPAIGNSYNFQDLALVRTGDCGLR